MGLDRIQDGGRDAEVVGQGLGDLGVDEGLGEDRGHALILRDLRDLGQAGGGGGGLGVEAGDADLGQARAIREVSESGMCGHERLDLAGRGLRDEGIAQRGQFLGEGLRVGLVGVGVGGVGLGELIAHQGRGLRHTHGVQPEMRVRGHVVVVLVALVVVALGLVGLGLVGALFLFFGGVVGVSAGFNELSSGGDVNDGLGGLLLDRLVDCALEAREVHNRIRGGQGVDHLGGELEVVGFGAVGSQGGDGDVLAADLFGQVLQRVEGGHDGQGLVLGGATRGRGRGGTGGQSERCGGRACGSKDSLRHENHSLCN